MIIEFKVTNLQQTLVTADGGYSGDKSNYELVSYQPS